MEIFSQIGCESTENLLFLFFIFFAVYLNKTGFCFATFVIPQVLHCIMSVSLQNPLPCKVPVVRQFLLCNRSGITISVVFALRGACILLARAFALQMALVTVPVQMLWCPL